MNDYFISLDHAFDYVGDNSRYQQSVIILFSIQWLFYSFFVMGMPIIFATPQFYCNNIENDTLSPCTEDEACFYYSKELFNMFQISASDQSLSKTFGLYCDQKYILGILGALLFIGSSISTVICSKVCDLIGRKTTLIITLLIASFSIIGSGFINEINHLMIAFFMVGVGFGGYDVVTQVYTAEISGNRFRNFSTSVLYISWAVGQIFVINIYQLIINWKYRLIFGMGIPLLLTVLLTHQFLVESPRYLVSKKKYIEAKQILKFISVYNLRPPYEFNLYEEIDTKNNEITKNKNTSKLKRSNTFVVRFFEICQNKTLFMQTFHLLYAWFLRYFVYYSLSFSVERLSDNTYLGYLLLAIVEILACLISAPVKLRYKRLSTLRFSTILMTFCPIILYLISIPKNCINDGEQQICLEELGQLIVASVIYIFYQLSKIMKFAICLYLLTLITYTNEIYPTIIRSQGIGTCMCFGLLFGSSMAPLILTQSAISSDQYLQVLALLGFIGFLQLFSLEETQKEYLKDNFDRNSERISVQTIDSSYIQNNLNLQLIQ